ncbi:MAG: isoamylase early set domain-containing protein [Nitrospirota bacterium]|mgnify:FL=1
MKKSAYSKEKVKVEKLHKLNTTGLSRTGIKKQYLKSNSMCKVTFKLPKEAAPDSRFVSIVGDFNNWNASKMRMKRLKNGDYWLSLNLPCNREYRFKYLINGDRWENDWCADKYAPNPYGSDDSVVVI